MFLLSAFIIAFLLCLLYDLLFLMRATGAESKAEGHLEKCSIVICARNELENLKQNLESWLDQDTAEVLIVDDRSTDGSKEFLASAAALHPRLRVVDNLDTAASGKREALSTGVKEATGEFLLFTDADCKPASPHWAKRMTSPLSNPQINIALGYGAYAPHPGFLNRLIRIETLVTASLYLGAARARLPYMGVGRNLAFRKDAVLEVIDRLPFWESLSGDDDQLVQLVSNWKNTTTVTHPDAVTWSEPEKTWKSWLKQKARHLGAGFNYDWKEKIIAGLFPVGRILRDILALICLYLGMNELLLLWVLGLAIHWVILWRNGLKLNADLNVHEIVLFDFAWGLYYLVSPVWLSIFKSHKWR